MFGSRPLKIGDCFDGSWLLLVVGFFFFQAEDGIRDWSVTGVQTCALPIWPGRRREPFRGPGAAAAAGRCGSGQSDGDAALGVPEADELSRSTITFSSWKIGRASCRERGEISVGGVSLRKESKSGGRRRG